MSQQEIKQPGFGSYLMALLVPFAYFFTRGRIAAGVISLAVCVISLPLMFLGIGFFLYGAMVLWAIWGLRNDSLEAHAVRTGRATAEAILAAHQQAQGSISTSTIAKE
jgi:TM2 domain-containing membrane protein YozV